MNLTIHRGTDQIGGCVTEYELNGWRLFVDYGAPLPGEPKCDPLQIAGLTHGDTSHSALLLTHYHGDHIGEIDGLATDLPIYMGQLSREIALCYTSRVGIVNEKQKRVASRLESARTFQPGEPFEFGPFRIMPLNVDHSAFDAYAFRIEAQGCSVFHTGDFRTHGFRSRKFEKALRTYVATADYVVCEATNISRPDAKLQTESDLQCDYVKRFKDNMYNIVYVASTNIDRLFSLYHAALRAHRPFYVDKYQKQIMDIVAKPGGLWSRSELYQYADNPPTELRVKDKEFYTNQKFNSFIKDRGFVLIARANPKFNNLIDKLPPAQRYLSMWEGYLQPGPAFNPQLADALKDGFELLHTSGHCDMASLDALFNTLTPKAIIPIHTNDPQAFAQRFAPSWQILTPTDGVPQPL